jgi:hypothetical protein
MGHFTHRGRSVPPYDEGMPRRIAVLASSLLLVGALTACTPALSYDQAQARYEAVIPDVVSALQAAYPAVTWEEAGTTSSSADTGECRMAFATAQGAPSLVETAGDWESVWSTVNPVLVAHEFPEITEPDELKGGWTGASSEDAHGARLRLMDKGQTKIELSVRIDDAGCDVG